MNDKFSASPHMAELIRTHAQRLAIEAEERAQRRLLELAEQRSDLNPPAVRIRAWEKVHHLRLPGDPTHPVLDVVAMATGLTLAQVQQEQRARVPVPSVSAAAQPEPSGNG